MADAPVPIGSLPALLALDDTEFVHAAYRALLGRDCDDTGLEHFTRRLRDGEDKRRLIADLALSDEGRRRHQTLPGLAELALTHGPRVEPWPRRAARAVLRRLAAPGREPVERALRAVDNRMYRLERALLAQTAELRALNHELGRVSAQLAASRLGTPAGRNDNDTTGAAPDLQARQVPSRVEQILRQMQQASARHGGKGGQG